MADDEAVPPSPESCLHTETHNLRVRVRVGQPSIYNSGRFPSKNVLIQQKPARVVYGGLAHS